MSSLNKKKILIVDDEPDVVAYIKILLEDQDLDTIVASNGADGYKLVLSDKPDLITLDITMPIESGVMMYRDLRENEATASIPVIIVTGIDENFKHFIKSRKNLVPPDGYFEKPIDKGEFISRVNELLMTAS
ncbi:MAG: response regulator [Candidatus Electryonea clarkiae]|nr:response regulator [Candidatus Electryonea clarkiae]MDP8285258.1 response regulator [Candidatus Electryonea clarkiae]